MSCFFCSSNNHVSHNCDIYNSNYERQRIIRAKRCCQNCLTQQNFHRILSCEKCEVNKKCYICFSRNHHTVLCSYRFTSSNNKAINIDQDLTPRFIKMLTNKKEQYPLLLSFSIDPDFVNLHPPFKVKSAKEIRLFYFTEFEEYDYIFAETTHVRRHIPRELYSINFSTQNLVITAIYFSREELFQLLSSPTKTLRCIGTTFHSPLTIVDILLKAPHLESVELIQTNITNNSWADELLQFKGAAKLKQITLSNSGLNLNVKGLAALMKKKSFNVTLRCLTPIKKEHVQQEFFQKLTKKLSNFFIPSLVKCLPSSVCLAVQVQGERNSNVSKQYVLKNV